MELSDKIAEIVRKEAKIVIDKEMQEKSYLSSDDFKTCYDRANVGIEHATYQAKLYLALCIAKHRSIEHGENTELEQKQLLALLKPEYLDENATVKEWWNP